MNILSPSILAADCANLKEEVRKVQEAGAKYLHIDVMDGMFVPSISFGMCVVASLRKASDMIFDVHLMVEDPIRYVEEFVRDGADIITVHLEACHDVAKTLEKIRSLGVKAGLSIKPATPVEAVRPFLEAIDMLLIMTVEPGFGGQKYMDSATDRIRSARRMIDESGRPVDIEVDGGITRENITTVARAGANVVVAGSAVFNGDAVQNTRELIAQMN